LFAAVRRGCFPGSYPTRAGEKKDRDADSISDLSADK
jgi:hypothetical protein